MKMIDLKLSKQQGEGVTEAPKLADGGDRWPYGMQLRFEAEQCEKMPQLKGMKIGAKVDIEGFGEITSIRMNEEKGGKEKYSVEIQMHQIGVEGKGKELQESMIDAMKARKKNMTIKLGS